MDKVLIRSLPKITPTQIAVPNTDAAKDQNGANIFSPEISEEGSVARRGSMVPIVMIGQARIPEQAIRTLIIWTDDLLPKMSITIEDTDSVFGAGAYPIANIIASIFVRSQNKRLKSLTGDYLITTVSSINIPNTNATIYTLGGELHVPKLHGNFSKSYSKMTSLEALKSVADDLNLGFADNQPDNTNDRMTWLMPNYSYHSLINHIKRMAYRDDNNFFDCFIDRYYILNFINVEKMFEQDPEIEKGFLALAQDTIERRRVSSDSEQADSDAEVDIILSNYSPNQGSEFFITDFSLIGHHGEVLISNALRRHAYWYDHGKNSNPDKDDSVNFIDHFTEPLTTPISNDGLAPQTVTIPDFANAESTTGAWMGVNYSNAHGSYKYAKMVNEHNLLETEKNMLKITVDGFNINVLRGSRVAVAIYMGKRSALRAEAARAEDDNVADANESVGATTPAEDNNAFAQVIDKSLSGFYYVKSIKYTYHGGKFHTDMILSRRHWLLPRPKNEVK
jgi:hypothetical protein